MSFTIKQSAPLHSYILTNVAFAAKKHWPYPDEYFQVWKNELTITPQYINANLVFHVEDMNHILGFFSLVYVEKCTSFNSILVEKGWWLDHMFILPRFHGKGIGKSMFKYAVQELVKMDVGELFIFVDPFAEGFYKKMGAKFLRSSQSSIPDRELPVYRFMVTI